MPSQNHHHRWARVADDKGPFRARVAPPTYTVLRHILDHARAEAVTAAVRRPDDAYARQRARLDKAYRENATACWALVPAVRCRSSQAWGHEFCALVVVAADDAGPEVVAALAKLRSGPSPSVSIDLARLVPLGACLAATCRRAACGNLAPRTDRAPKGALTYGACKAHVLHDSFVAIQRLAVELADAADDRRNPARRVYEAYLRNAPAFNDAVVWLGDEQRQARARGKAVAPPPKPDVKSRLRANLRAHEGAAREEDEEDEEEEEEEEEAEEEEEEWSRPEGSRDAERRRGKRPRRSPSPAPDDY
ncbi:hypothetical protein CC85DRAFT_306111 [Cutaneotrichosporon oleaginosum]|uniref:Uncharacterized protein n=1 Tax=Cutaneotrichosporon oleaginosum TaxID=879819 RepID=A0A0J1ASE6_9TREE|nr:uncharacterized protein CC85DRAFT_306111 [Cutaneotrichosporon oleaginosum]KLT38279.1 hypothetical protein CC85DRAFT_306111 [Cutaneotrichosporon oleaginosum]TXT06923.1 hypothetical protein COLE_06254 [Cutaneotrichosporon oleaginosum]